jgi:hypothetical protein
VCVGQFHVKEHSLPCCNHPSQIPTRAYWLFTHLHHLNNANGTARKRNSVSVLANPIRKASEISSHDHTINPEVSRRHTFSSFELDPPLGAATVKGSCDLIGDLVRLLAILGGTITTTTSDLVYDLALNSRIHQDGYPLTSTLDPLWTPSDLFGLLSFDTTRSRTVQTRCRAWLAVLVIWSKPE